MEHLTISKKFEKQLQTLPEGKERIDVLNEYAFEIRRTDTKRAFELSEEALKLLEKISYPKGMADALRTMGFCYWLFTNYYVALTKSLDALKFYQRINNQKGQADTMNTIAKVYTALRDYENANKFFQNCIRLTKETGDREGQALTLSNTGDMYMKKGDFLTALDYFKKSISVVPDDSIEIRGLVFYNIGEVYFHLGDNKNSMEYLKKSIFLTEKIKYDLITTANLCVQGKIFIKQKETDKAITALKRAIKIAEEIDSKLDIYQAQLALAEAYEQQKDFQSAFQMYKAYHKILEEVLNQDNVQKIKNIQFEQETEAIQREKEMERKKNVELEVAYKKIQQTAVELERLSIVASKTNNVVLILDANGEVEWVNEAFVRLNGITLEDLKKQKGKTIYEISNNPQVRNIIQTAIREKKLVVYESLNITNDGRKIWESSNITPIFKDDGTLHKLVVIDIDVTERKLAEEIIQKKNKDITDSINYARRIQQAILPSNDLIFQTLNDSFILYKPKDIVSGDFYFFAEKKGKVIIGAVDCTGHGVPGAFMSLIGNELLNQIVVEKEITTPSEILNQLNENIKIALKQYDEDAGSKDGMDVALCTIDLFGKRMEFAGAYRPLYLFRNQEIGVRSKTVDVAFENHSESLSSSFSQLPAPKPELTEIKGDKFPVAGYHLKKERLFTNHEISFQKGDTFYIFTDGFADQFGGPGKKKFMSRHFKELLLSIQHLSMKEQGAELEKQLENWKGDAMQMDDILVMGIRL